MAHRTFSVYMHDVSEGSEVRAGTPLSLGAHQQGDGVNFALFSRDATRVWLDFFNHPEDSIPSRTIEIDPEHHRTGDVWHVWVQGVKPGQLYAYRVDGPYRPQEGHRFNAHKLLLDPYATAITHLDTWDFGPARGYDPGSSQRDLSFSALDNAGAVPKCVFTYDHFHWGETRPPKHPRSESVIYETHVRGYTIHPSSGVAYPGTYRGLTEKIPYLKDLGVTAVELMPVFEFNENELARANPLTGERLKNYWGYNPVAFQAPESSYSSAGSADLYQRSGKGPQSNVNFVTCHDGFTLNDFELPAQAQRGQRREQSRRDG